MANGARDLADRIILFYGDQQPGPGRGIEINNRDQIVAIGVEDYADLNATLTDLLDADLLAFAPGVVNGRRDLEIGQRRTMRLTIAGRERYRQLTANRGGENAFMAMAFDDPQMDRIYQDHFQPTLLALGLRLATVRPRAGLIDDNIRAQIAASRLVLADLTHDNRGVYLEAGYAQGIGRDVIYTCRTDVFDERRPHFDAEHHYCVRWSDPPTNEELGELQDCVRNTLRGA